MQPQDFDVAHQQSGALDRGHYFGQSGDVAAGENVFRNPGIGDIGPVRTADRMQHHDAVVGQKFGAAPEVGLVEVDADVLEHSDRYDAVEGAGNVAIILEQKSG